MSNSSGLAAVLDSAKQSGASNAQLSQSTVSFSITYITSMLGPMFIIVFFQRLFKVNFLAEAKTLPEYERSMQELTTTSIRVNRASAELLTIDDVSKVDGQLSVVFGRIIRDDQPLVPTGDLHFKQGDLAVAVGTTAQLCRVSDLLGEQLPEEVEHERTELELRRVFVSNSAIVGIPLSRLELTRKLGVKITRVRRGDTEFIPNGSTRLELGDRLRVFSQHNNMPNVRTFFGDSFTAISEVDFLALGLGVSAGLLLGLIPFPLPGGLTLKLGFAGGPLIAGILLARLNRSGPVIWTLPFSANLTLRQFGLTLFAAAIGTQAGYSFLDTVLHHHGGSLFLAGLAINLVVGVATMFLGYRLLKSPMNHLIGVYAGGLTQPIVLGFAKDRAGNDLPSTGYAAVFPIATVIKIVISELLFGFLR
jgi:putative transport protein